MEFQKRLSSLKRGLSLFIEKDGSEPVTVDDSFSTGSSMSAGWGFVVVGGITGSVIGRRLGSSGLRVGGLSPGVAGGGGPGLRGRIWSARDAGWHISGLREGGAFVSIGGAGQGNVVGGTSSSPVLGRGCRSDLRGGLHRHW
ncbi:hypothetical protein TIFTF001_016137 [Ficus carica]|uniref:Uncharacterized protein n=1 Tax=Ficus carica TaxID=3494 RepID=A0AA88A5Q9_FICCA|nr:hypothetical protein TIFTF001_016137 [Ficus carica]